MGPFWGWNRGRRVSASKLEKSSTGRRPKVKQRCHGPSECRPHNPLPRCLGQSVQDCRGQQAGGARENRGHLRGEWISGQVEKEWTPSGRVKRKIRQGDEIPATAPSRPRLSRSKSAVVMGLGIIYTLLEFESRVGSVNATPTFGTSRPLGTRIEVGFTECCHTFSTMLQHNPIDPVTLHTSPHGLPPRSGPGITQDAKPPPSWQRKVCTVQAGR